VKHKNLILKLVILADYDIITIVKDFHMKMISVMCISFYNPQIIQIYKLTVTTLTRDKIPVVSPFPEQTTYYITNAVLTAWFSIRAKMTFSICVKVALAVVWLIRFLLAR